MDTGDWGLAAAAVAEVAAAGGGAWRRGPSKLRRLCSEIKEGYGYVDSSVRILLFAE